VQQPTEVVTEAQDVGKIVQGSEQIIAVTPAEITDVSYMEEDQLPGDEELFEQSYRSQAVIPPAEPFQFVELDDPEEVDDMAEPVPPAPLRKPLDYASQEAAMRAKQSEVENLVHRAVEYLSNHTPHDAFHTFTHDKSFRKGEVYLFAFDTNGVCLAHGKEMNLVWSNLYELKDTYGNPIVQEIINKARGGGGWITYHWRNATKNAYVKEVRVGNKTYILGSGYYPHSKPDAVVNLVKGAVAFFNNTIKQGRSPNEAFGSFSYPLGKFVFGDLYLYALDFNGMQMAHGEMPGLIGTNAWEYQDATGAYVNQEIVAKLNNVTSGGIWIEYMSKNTRKRTYAEKVVDGQGKKYFIASGYYPEANRREVEELVKRGYVYMKKNGKAQAVRAFNDKINTEFRFGDLYLFVYDMQGTIVAHGGNPALVGQNQYDQQDMYGNYFVRDMIKKAQDGGGFLEFKSKNSFIAVYVEPISLGTEQLIIGSGVYPVSKQDTMVMLTKSGASYLQSNPDDVAFSEFTKSNGKFVRGDLALFAFDQQGICYAHGDDYNLIWRNLSDFRDDTGKAYVPLMINTAKRGPGRVTYILNGRTFRAHVEPVMKDGLFYVVGSGYYE
jgi:signal transduction histidine kinase